MDPMKRYFESIRTVSPIPAPPEGQVMLLLVRHGWLYLFGTRAVPRCTRPSNTPTITVPLSHLPDDVQEYSWDQKTWAVLSRRWSERAGRLVSAWTVSTVGRRQTLPKWSTGDPVHMLLLERGHELFLLHHRGSPWIVEAFLSVCTEARQSWHDDPCYLEEVPAGTEWTRYERGRIGNWRPLTGGQINAGRL